MCGCVGVWVWVCGCVGVVCVRRCECGCGYGFGCEWLGVVLYLQTNRHKGGRRIEIIREK